MTIDMPEAPELPDLPAFDNRAMRRAVRRGVVRTAFVGALWLVLASVVLSIGGHAALVGLSREDHLERVVAVGWQVAHPEYIVMLAPPRTGYVHVTEAIAAQPLGAQPVPGFSKLSFTESLFGGVSRSDPDPTTVASSILQNLGAYGILGGGVRASERKMLEQLPKPVRVAAVIEFVKPLSYADYKAFASRNGATMDLQDAPLLLGAVGDPTKRLDGSHVLTGVCAWAPIYSAETHHAAPSDEDPIGGFRSWVHSLHDSDRDALLQVGVDLSFLRASAQAGLVHGVIVTAASADQLLKYLNDPAVATVHPYDVAFAVEGS